MVRFDHGMAEIKEFSLPSKFRLEQHEFRTSNLLVLIVFFNYFYISQYFLTLY